MDLIPADAVVGVPAELRDFRIAQKELLCRVDDGAVKIEAPVTDTRETGTAVAPFGSGGALLRPRSEDFLNLAVVDDGQRDRLFPCIAL